QGTPGGSVLGRGGTTTTTGSQGQGAGGTTTGAGGAGTGTSGVVTSTLGVGSPIPAFDPIISGTPQMDRNDTPSCSSFAGVPDIAFRLQVITSVDQIETIYWDLVSAYQNVKVQQDSLTLAQKVFEDNKKQVQIGTLAPIEVVRAQSVVATNQQNLIVAQTNLQ